MTESDFEYLIRTLSEARSRATELTVAVRAQTGAGHRLADLGTSAVSNIEKLLREVRVLAVDPPPQARPMEKVAAAPPVRLASEHWLQSFIHDLSTGIHSPSEASFENVERLLEKYKQNFLKDLETARRMYRVYPHLFQAGNSRTAGAN